MVGIIIDGPNTLLRIDQVWMAVSVDADGNEGVCSAPLSTAPGSLTVPLIAADEARLPFIIDMARLIADATGKRVRIIRLHTRTEEHVFEPKGGARQ